MFKVSHTTLIVLSGLIWLAIGMVLLAVGLNFIFKSILLENVAHLQHPFLNLILPYVKNLDQAALYLIGIGFLIGYFKGRYVLGKTVQKSIERLLSLSNPALHHLYTKKYLILLGVMVLLGVLVRLAPLDVRGAVDVAIGTALITGATLYLMEAWRTRQFICGKKTPG
jgi:hypothetical protein